jgi:hypothetical protein
MTVPWFILTSYTYYVEDDPVVSDACYDFIFKYMLTYWENIVHIHKDIVFAAIGSKSTTGSGFAIKYPNRIKYAVSNLRRMQNEVDTAKESS